MNECLIQDNPPPHFSAFERHAELAASELPRVHRNSRFEPAGLAHLTIMSGFAYAGKTP